LNTQANWWQSFFQGVAVDMWLEALPPEHTAREADGLAQALAVPVSAEVLDVRCGAGRLSLALAQRGNTMMAVDWSTEFLTHARSSDTSADVRWEQRDMRDLPWRAHCDAAFCVGNASATSTTRATRRFSGQWHRC